MSPEQIAAELGRGFVLVVPEIILVVGACLLFLGSTFRGDRNLWATVALVSLVLLVIAGMATALPARASTKIDPTMALRSDT